MLCLCKSLRVLSTSPWLQQRAMPKRKQSLAHHEINIHVVWREENGSMKCKKKRKKKSIRQYHWNFQWQTTRFCTHSEHILTKTVREPHLAVRTRPPELYSGVSKLMINIWLVNEPYLTFRKGQP